MYRPDDHTTVANIEYEQTQLSTDGSQWELTQGWVPTVDAWSPIYTDMLEPFCADRYTSPRLPIDLGDCDMNLVAQCPRVLRVSIKEAGSDQVHLPAELLPMEPIIRRLLQYEGVVNPRLHDFHVHLTLDHGAVTAGHTQRFPGWHADGLQGGKFPQKLPCEHSYIAATAPGPQICLQPFFVAHYNDSKDNLFKAFDQQAIDSNVYETLPNHIYLMDPYVVHRTPTITEDGHRSFFRLTIANAPLPNEFNTLNPMLSEMAYESKIDVRDVVQAPSTPILWEQYGLVNTRSTLPTVVADGAKQSKTPFADPDLSGDGQEVTITPKRYPIVQPWSPTYRDIHEPFQLEKYTNPRLPIDLGAADIAAIEQCPNVLRMPLKWSGDEHVLLPHEFQSIKPLISRLFTYERQICSYYTNFAAHITIDSRDVEPHATQRFPGFHGDDLQGGIFDPKVITAHSYIITTDPATEVCLQPFFVAHLNDTFEKVFDAFDQQAREENIVSVIPNHIYLVDPYNVHRSPVIQQACHRTFLRITFSPVEMLLPHHSVNPLFADRPYPGDDAIHLDESWFLVTPDRPVPYSYYGMGNRAV